MDVNKSVTDIIIAKKALRKMRNAFLATRTLWLILMIARTFIPSGRRGDYDLSIRIDLFVRTINCNTINLLSFRDVYYPQRLASLKCHIFQFRTMTNIQCLKC